LNINNLQKEKNITNDNKEEPSTLIRSGILLTNIPTPTAE